MQSFHNDQAVKGKYLSRVIAHREADNIIRGTGWEDGKGCAVGCTLENYDHSQYPVELGIPEWLARVEDTLFEGMSLEKSKTWPEKFLAAIPVGVSEDTFERKVKAPFLIAVLESVLETFDHQKFPDVKKAIEGSIALWQRNDIGSDAWNTAARAAARAAEKAAWAAVEAAAWAAWAAWAAEKAAWAAWAAAGAAGAAGAAAGAAEAAARAAAGAAGAAGAAKYDRFADMLLALLEKSADGVVIEEGKAMNLYKVNARKKLTVHRIADCFDCDWSLSDYRDDKMADKCRKHVAETGHTVGYETGTSTVYSRGGIACPQQI